MQLSQSRIRRGQVYFEQLPLELRDFMDETGIPLVSARKSSDAAKAAVGKVAAAEAIAKAEHEKKEAKTKALDRDDDDIMMTNENKMFLIHYVVLL